MQTRDKVELVPVTLPFVERVWPLVRPFAEKAMKHARGEDTPEMFLEDCRRQQAQIWLIAEGITVVAAGGTSVDTLRNGKRILNVRWIAGRGYRAWQHHFDRVKGWAREQGCASIYYRGRPGWQRRRPQARVTAYIYEESL